MNNNYTNNEIIEEAQKVSEFLSVLKLFTILDYDGRVKYMEEHWGHNLNGKTIYYGKFCKVLISFENDERYHFSFESDNCDQEKFQSTFGELAQLMQNNDVERIKQLYPGLQEFSCPQIEQVDVSSMDLTSDYLKIYNNVSIDKLRISNEKDL